MRGRRAREHLLPALHLRAVGSGTVGRLLRGEDRRATCHITYRHLVGQRVVAGGAGLARQDGKCRRALLLAKGLHAIGSGAVGASGIVCGTVQVGHILLSFAGGRRPAVVAGRARLHTSTIGHIRRRALGMAVRDQVSLWAALHRLVVQIIGHTLGGHPAIAGRGTRRCAAAGRLDRVSGLVLTGHQITAIGRRWTCWRTALHCAIGGGRWRACRRARAATGVAFDTYPAVAF